MPTKRIGVIGLGLLGGAIAARLRVCNHDVLGFDIDQQRRDLAHQNAIQVASDSQAVFSKCERVILSLPTSETVKTVLSDVEPAVHPGQFIIDTTTGQPAHMAEFAKQIAQLGAYYLDASVAGSSDLARQGKVVVLVGGDETAFRNCADVFAAIAKETFYAGPSGSGAKLKLVHNLILGLHRAVLAEGLHFAEMIGLAPGQTLAILKDTVAYSRAMDLKGDKMVTGDFSPQATLSQHLKDVRLMLAEAASRDGTLPLTALHQQLLQQAESAGFGNQDNSAIINAFRKVDP